jgi:hypothetical protein
MLGHCNFYPFGNNRSCGTKLDVSGSLHVYPLFFSFFRGNPWTGAEQLPPDKHSKDIPFLEKYALERWEVITFILIF